MKVPNLPAIEFLSVCQCVRLWHTHKVQRLGMRRNRQQVRSNTQYIMLLTEHQMPPTSSKKLFTISWSTCLDSRAHRARRSLQIFDTKAKANRILKWIGGRGFSMGDLGDSCIMRWLTWSSKWGKRWKRWWQTSDSEIFLLSFITSLICGRGRKLNSLTEFLEEVQCLTFYKL